MLPGFRLLFAAILLTVSALVFGLGAAALLRATHEEFVSNPAWRKGLQERVFAQAPEPARPVLAVLRLEPPPPPTSLRDEVPTIGLPAGDPDQTAAVRSDDESEPVTQTAEALISEHVEDTSVIASADAPAPLNEPVSAETPAIFTSTEPVVVAEPAPVASPEPRETIATVASAEPATRAAATPSPVIPAKHPPAKRKVKASSNAPEKQASKRHAHRSKPRHRVVRRPAPAAPVQQTFDPFNQQPIQQQQQPVYAATGRKR